MAKPAKKPRQPAEELISISRSELQKLERAAQAAEEPSPDGDREIQIPPDETPDDDALAAVLGELGETMEASVKVYRISPRDKRQEYLFQSTPAEYLATGLDHVRDTYGGGDYYIRVYANGVLRTHRKISIANPRAALPGMASATPAPQESGLSGFAIALENLGRSFSEGLKAIAESQKPPSMADQLSLVKTLIEVTRPPQAPAPAKSGIAEFLEMFKLAREMAGDGGAGRSDLDAFVEVARPAVQAIATQLQAPRPAPDASAAPGAQAAPVMSPESIALHAAWFLIRQAQNGADPELYGDVILDQLDDATLRTMLGGADWWAPIAAQFPGAVPYREWFERVRDYIMKETEPAAPDAPAPDAPPKKPRAKPVDEGKKTE